MAFPFSLSLLTTKSSCTELIAKLMAKKTKLTLVKQTLEVGTTHSAGLASTVETANAEVVAELANLALRIPALPEGKKKKQLVAQQMALEARKFSLEIRRDEHGVVAQLEHEFDYSNAIAAVTGADDLIAAVQAHKDTLTVA